MCINCNFNKKELLSQNLHKAKDRRSSDYSKYRDTVDRLKAISEKLENFSGHIDGIFIKQG